MSQIQNCSFSPQSANAGSGDFVLSISARLVNNALLCKCVTVEVQVGGTQVGTFTTGVEPGGGSNPTDVTADIQMDDPASNPALPSNGGKVDVDIDITNESNGCGPVSCDSTVNVSGGPRGVASGEGRLTVNGEVIGGDK